MMENIANYTTLSQPFVEFGTNGSAARQATATDFTIYCGVGGIDVAKLAASEITGVFVQIGIGNMISPLLDEQIAATLQAGKALAFFHIPDPRDGNGKQNAAFAVNAIRSRGFTSNLIEKDFEQASSTDANSLMSAAESWNYSEEIDFLTGREHVGYSNPNVLLYKWGMPNWIYWMHWNVARYPKIWYHYSEFFTDYPWSIPTGYLSDEFYRLCKGVQFTKKLRAKEYFSVDRLPDGGDGLNSGDGYAFLMTPEELVPWFNGAATPPAEPPADWEAELQAVKDDIEQIEGNLVEFDTTFDYILATLTDFDARLTKLEDAEPPEADDDTMWVEVIGDDNLPLGIAVDHDAACQKLDPNADPKGKPIIEHPPQAERIIYKPGEQIKVYRRFKYSCKDSSDTPTIKATGDVLHYVAVDGYLGTTSFVLASRVRKI